MPVGLGPRFLVEAGFLVAVAVIAGFARFDTWTIVLVMAVAWLLVAAAEWFAARSRRTRAAAELAPAAEPAVWAEPRRVVTPPPTPTAVQNAEPPPAPPPEVVPQPIPEPTPAPESEPEPEEEPAAPPSEPVPSQPRVQLVPPPPPAAEPQPEPEPERQPDPLPQVVSITPRSGGAPREWNLWDLERIARDAAGSDVVRDEERSYLLMYLRDFANADGILPADFDSVVRESFGDALDAAYSS